MSSTGTKSWVFIFTRIKKVEMGLGAYPDVGLADARGKAATYRAEVAAGRDPRRLRDKAGEPTFGECSEEMIASMEAGWRNAKHRAQWRSTLSTYCSSIWTRPVSEVFVDDVLKILQPIWTTKAETASRLRGRIERVLDYATAKGWRQAPNPAVWRGSLRALLPPAGKLKRGHHKAMPYAAVPAFLVALREQVGISPRALEFLILTAARTGEVTGATWDEFDFDAALWTIPGSRMKAGVTHRVPLTDRALAIVQSMFQSRISDYVFPGEREDRPLSNMAFTMLLRRMGQGDITGHGFRSSFRDWAGDKTHHAREVAEAALAHKTGNDTEAAYRRSDALEKRRKLMEDWETYCLASPVKEP